MIKKIYLLTYFIVVISLLSIGYTGSYFSDNETSDGNTFTAGTWSDCPPNNPSNPNPENNATDVELNPTLSVYVSDPDNDTMNVSFYNAANNSLIGNVTNAESNTTVSAIWYGLEYEVTYEWYVVAEDYSGSNQSDTWCFTTMPCPPGGGGSGGGSPPSNSPPIADAGGQYSSSILETILCNGSNSFDPDGTIVSYYWSFGDGTDATGTNATATHQYTDVGVYTVTLIVTDNDGATGTNTTTVTITSFLEITNVIATPNIQTMGEHVNITCNITNTSGLVDVVLNINSPNNNSTTLSIYQNSTGNSTIYYYNQTYTLLGIYEYYIWACDTENHTTITETYQFSITNSTDIAPPEISNILANPEEQEKNGYINISATVTDDNEVKDVFLNITSPDNSASNITMTRIDGTVAYYYNSTYSDMGEYTFFIFATDTSNNTATSNISHFSIVDLQPPEIADNTPEVAYKNETFTFNATVTDNNMVADVYVEYWYETENHTNVSMNNIDEDSWNKTIMIPSNFDILQYIVHARDTSNNWNHTEIKSVTLLENN